MCGRIFDEDQEEWIGLYRSWWSQHLKHWLAASRKFTSIVTTISWMPLSLQILDFLLYDSPHPTLSSHSWIFLSSLHPWDLPSCFFSPRPEIPLWPVLLCIAIYLFLCPSLLNLFPEIKRTHQIYLVTKALSLLKLIFLPHQRKSFGGILIETKVTESPSRACFGGRGG